MSTFGFAYRSHEKGLSDMPAKGRFEAETWSEAREERVPPPRTKAHDRKSERQETRRSIDWVLRALPRRSAPRRSWAEAPPPPTQKAVSCAVASFLLEAMTTTCFEDTAQRKHWTGRTGRSWLHCIMRRSFIHGQRALIPIYSQGMHGHGRVR